LTVPHEGDHLCAVEGDRPGFLEHPVVDAHCAAAGQLHHAGSSQVFFVGPVDASWVVAATHLPEVVPNELAGP
jgi:hypothetical protein